MKVVVVATNFEASPESFKSSTGTDTGTGTNGKTKPDPLPFSTPSRPNAFSPGSAGYSAFGPDAGLGNGFDSRYHPTESAEQENESDENVEERRAKPKKPKGLGGWWYWWRN